MPAHEQIRLETASEWTSVFSNPEERAELEAKITNKLVRAAQTAQTRWNSDRKRAVRALYIIQAANRLIGARGNVRQITLIKTHPQGIWRYPVGSISTERALRDVLVKAGMDFHPNINPEVQLHQEGGRPNASYVLIEGALPAPAEVIEIPGMEHVKRMLDHDVHIRDAHRPESPVRGIGYLTFTGEGLEQNAIGIGFGDPTNAGYTGGKYAEINISLAGIRQQLGWPPPVID
jgi:hypothetical protein